MSKIFLTSAYRYEHNPIGWLLSNSRNCELIITDNAEEADVIIFIDCHPPKDPYFEYLRFNKYYRKYKKKCVLYHDADLSITRLPTISPSIEHWQYNPKHKRTAHYIARFDENAAIENAIVSFKSNRQFLYSFIGSQTHAVRRKIFNMDHPQNTFIKNTNGVSAWDLDSRQREAYESQYLEVMMESLFILCPRGIGPCTYRLFETMQLGRVPVIISDAWVKIPGVPWDSCSITVPQREIDRIPEILEERKSQAVEMGKNARQCWDKFFSPEASLQQIATSALDLISNKYSYLDLLSDKLQFLRSRGHFVNYFRYKKNDFKRRFLGGFL